MKIKLVLKILAVSLAVLVAVGAGVYGWASVSTSSLLARTFETHSVDFPLPFPLTLDELVERGIEEDDGNRIALERAIDRGRHLVESRYACVECHGQNFSGGVMIDAAPIGTLLGPNLTAGEGSRTVGSTPRDWDRIVRHGVKPDGTPATMPSVDYELMTDQELSDVVTYIRSRPPMFGEVPPIALGPLGKFLVATGQLPLSADLIESHDAPHERYPPESTVSEEFGRHLAGVCTGCHRADLAGGPIPGGDPSWASARNITPHAEGLAGWTLDQFAAALTEGVRPDGTEVLLPMTLMQPYALNMTDVELAALFTYLQSVPPLPSRE
jgi:mono/diheme cytochrome c family protein